MCACVYVSLSLQDEHYTVSVMASGRHIAKHERFTSVAFSSHKGLLAAGTEVAPADPRVEVVSLDITDGGHPLVAQQEAI